MSTSTDFTSKEIGSDFRIPSELKTRPSKAFIVLGDLVRGGETMGFQQPIDMIHVEAPSSIMVQKMEFVATTTCIWNASCGGSLGTCRSKSKPRTFSEVGSTTPIMDNRAFRCASQL